MDDTRIIIQVFRIYLFEACVEIFKLGVAKMGISKLYIGVGVTVEGHREAMFFLRQSFLTSLGMSV